MPIIEVDHGAVRGELVANSAPEVFVARSFLGRRQQRRAHSLPARPAVHQHLGKIAAMRLVLRQIEDHLHGADDAARRNRGLAECQGRKQCEQR